MTDDRATADGHWWAELDDQVVRCLATHGAMSPSDVARHVGLPEPATVSLLCMLAQEGRVRLSLVAADAGAAADRFVA